MGTRQENTQVKQAIMENPQKLTNIRTLANTHPPRKEVPTSRIRTYQEPRRKEGEVTRPEAKDKARSQAPKYTMHTH